LNGKKSRIFRHGVNAATMEDLARASDRGTRRSSSSRRNRASQSFALTLAILSIDCARLSAGLFNLPAETIAESLASKEVSPQGASSGLRLLTFYMNYAGKRLSPLRRRNLEKARKLLSDRVTRELIEREREQERAA
jgi:hypothetical protein